MARSPSARLLKELRETKATGLKWGHGLFAAGLLPVDHPYIPRSDNTRRRQAIEEVFHRALFDGYMASAKVAGLTKEKMACC